jgi:hypothetical protein
VDLFIWPVSFNFECLLSLGAATYKECKNLWILSSTSELVNLTILNKKKISLIKKSEERKKYIRGALDSAHVLSHEKSNYLVKMQQENSAHFRFRN